MKRIILSLSIVLMLTSSSFSQDIKPSGFWLELFFPEVADYMEEMETKIDDMQTQLNDLRGDYLMYQHYMNISTNFLADAASSFGIAGVYYDAGSSYYSDYSEWWDYGGWLYNASYDYYEEALEYAEDLGIPVEVGSPLSFRLLRHDLSKAEIAPKKK